jgi:Tfp pilus assembly protein PilO
MNTLAMNRPLRREFDLKRRLLEPIDTWSRRRTVLTGVVFGALVGVLGAQMWRASGLNGLDAGRSALVEAQKRVEKAKGMRDRLPALRARAVAAEKQAPQRWSSVDALHAIPALATQNGLRVAAIEPAAAKGAPIERAAAKGAVIEPAAAAGTTPAGERVLKLRADGTFSEVRSFLDALGGLPRLVVADAVQLKRGPNDLAFEATLHVFETLPAVARPAGVDRRDVSVIDPFGKKGAAAFGPAADMLLVGTLVGRQRAMALVETTAGVDGFAPGQMIGDERLGRIHARSIDLARGDGKSRTVAFAEDRP